MNRFILILLLSVLTCGLSVTAQADTNEKPMQSDSRWMTEVRSYKHSFLIKETELTDSQCKEFIPLYTEMEKKIYQANKDARSLEQELTASSKDISDEEYEKVATALSQIKAKEADIENDYFQQFSKILNKKQLFLLKRAENRFARNMLNHNKQSKATK